jgi:hypothetical protein
MAETIRFRALLDSDEDSHGVFIQMPFSAQERFGSRGRVPVRGTINGFPFRSTLAPYGGVHYLPVNRALREAAGVEPGDTVEVALQRDDEPRVAAIPPDLADALAANPDAQAAWDRLSYTHRKEYAQALEDAKKPETRARRLAQTLEQMTAKKNSKKNPN